MNTIINLSSVAYNVILIATTIAMGIALSRIKIAGVSLGVTWILFVGIFAGSIGMTLDPAISLFIKEFGLILFIYSIGTQVGPAFFSSFKDGGLSLNLLAVTLILLGSLTAYLIHLVTREDMSAMIGVLYGAVTNTPGLGAAQQTFSDLHEGVANPLYAQGYAVAYPLGVVGIIMSIITIRKIFNIDFQEEQKVFDNNIRTGRLPKMKKKSVIFTGNSDITLEQLFSTFIGIAIGVFIGSLPISIPGMPVPVKLGLAGGPLIVSIIFSRYG
ncbi:MAG: transporter, partial [Bacteroidales bacterium]|nr:transporter [Bacteroidales bacterium]